MNLFDVLEQVKTAERRWLESQYEDSGVFFRFRELDSQEYAKAMEVLTKRPLPTGKQFEEVAKTGDTSSIPQDQLFVNMVTLMELAATILTMNGVITGWRGLTLAKFYDFASREPNFPEEKANEQVEYDPALADQIVKLCAQGSNNFMLFLATSALNTFGLRETEKKT